jgi:hypothetical protein
VVPAVAAPVDHFGTLACARLPLPVGRWRLQTLSDDGVRVRIDGATVLENWTWHGPTRDEALFEIERPRDVLVEVEHFELDGDAILEVRLQPAETGG